MMGRTGVSLALAVAMLTLAGAAKPPQVVPSAPPSAGPKTVDPTQDVLAFTMKRIDGKDENLADYRGKVVVLVNVASKCGYTVQYKALEELYAKHKDAGLVILGFPANDFGKQEPGTNEQIAEFCTKNYGVTFPIFEKISVKGDDQHPLYKRLGEEAAKLDPKLGGEPKWNFTKFVIDREGKVVGRFDAKGDGKDRAALEPGLEKRVEELLATPKK